MGGPIAQVMDGDMISFDLIRGEVVWKGNAAARQVFPAFKSKEIYLREFSQNTTQAHQGCVAKQVLEK